MIITRFATKEFKSFAVRPLAGTLAVVLSLALPAQATVYYGIKSAGSHQFIPHSSDKDPVIVLKPDDVLRVADDDGTAYELTARQNGEHDTWSNLKQKSDHHYDADDARSKAARYYSRTDARKPNARGEILNPWDVPPDVSWLDINIDDPSSVGLDAGLDTQPVKQCYLGGKAQFWQYKPATEDRQLVLVDLEHGASEFRLSSGSYRADWPKGVGIGVSGHSYVIADLSGTAKSVTFTLVGLDVDSADEVTPEMLIEKGCNLQARVLTDQLIRAQPANP